MVVLILGLGSISKKHIIALKSLNIDITIYAFRSSKNAHVEEDVINIFDIDEIKGKPDFAIISNPTNMHFESISFLTDLAIPMFIEKPAIHTLESSETLVEKVEKAGVFTYVACNLRFHPCIQFIHTFLKSNPEFSINEVNSYCGSYLPDWRPNLDYKQVYSANKKQGGGVHLDLFHEIDYTYWLFGKPDKSKATLSHKSTLGINAVDYANYVLEYANFNISIILNYYRKDAKRTLEIVGNTETILVDLIKNEIYGSKAGCIYKNDSFNIIDTYKDQMKYFVDHLNSNKKTMNTLSDSIEALKITLINE